MKRLHHLFIPRSRASALGLFMLMALCLWQSGAGAQDEVYVCTGANGAKEYRNNSLGRHCKRMEISAGTTIPAPPSASANAARNGVTKPVNSPTDFPKVDSSVQKARDNDRRQILSDELAREEKKLYDFKQGYNGGEPERRGDERNYAKYQERVATLKSDIARAEKNIDALKREISNLK